MMECLLASAASAASRGGSTWNVAGTGFPPVLLKIPEVLSLGREAGWSGWVFSGSGRLGDTLLAEVAFLPCFSALWYLWSEATRGDLGLERLCCSTESPGMPRGAGMTPQSLGIKGGIQEPRARSASRFKAWDSQLSPGGAKAAPGIPMG